MDPFSIAAVSAGASVLGGAITAGGTLAGGASQQAMYNYQAGVAQLNSKIALQNADYTQTAGGTAGYQSGLKTGAIVGTQKADQGASGVDVGSGSAAGVRDTTTKLGQYDQDLIATNYAKKAYGYEVEAATKTAEAGADVIAGENAVKASKISAAGSILGTVGSVSSKWLQGSSVFSKGDSGSTSSPVYPSDDI